MAQFATRPKANIPTLPEPTADPDLFAQDAEVADALESHAYVYLHLAVVAEAEELTPLAKMPLVLLPVAANDSVDVAAAAAPLATVSQAYVYLFLVLV